jgi:hypothetical protein
VGLAQEIGASSLPSAGSIYPLMPSLCLCPSFRHADIPDICVHYVGGFLDALIQGLKEVRALGSKLVILK